VDGGPYGLVGAHVQHRLELTGKGSLSSILAHGRRANSKRGFAIPFAHAHQARLHLRPRFWLQLVIGKGRGQDDKSIWHRVARLIESGQRAAFAPTK